MLPASFDWSGRMILTETPIPLVSKLIEYIALGYELYEIAMLYSVPWEEHR